MLVAADIIKHQFKSGEWKAYRDGIPVSHETLKINPHSIDITLSHQVLIMTVAPGHHCIDIHDPDSFRCVEHSMPADGIVLHPHSFILGCARERFDSTEPIKENDFSAAPTFVTQLYDGRSTTGRLGIQSHMTAGYGDFGFTGCFTLEIAVKLPIRLRPFMRIGQVSFVPLKTWASRPDAYNGVYTQIEPMPAKPVIGLDRF